MYSYTTKYCTTCEAYYYTVDRNDKRVFESSHIFRQREEADQDALKYVKKYRAKQRDSIKDSLKKGTNDKDLIRYCYAVVIDPQLNAKFYIFVHGKLTGSDIGQDVKGSNYLELVCTKKITEELDKLLSATWQVVYNHKWIVDCNWDEMIFVNPKPYRFVEDDDSLLEL